MSSIRKVPSAFSLYLFSPKNSYKTNLILLPTQTDSEPSLVKLKEAVLPSVVLSQEGAGPSQNRVLLSTDISPAEA